MSNIPLFAGRILNRFTKDTGLMDDQLPTTFYDFMQVRTELILRKLWKNKYNWLYKLSKIVTYEKKKKGWLLYLFQYRKVNENNLVGGQFLIFCFKKMREIIYWVDNFKFLSALTQIMCCIGITFALIVDQVKQKWFWCILLAEKSFLKYVCLNHG